MTTDAATAIERVSLTLVDDTRPTPANGSFDGAPHRTLETVVSYPVRVAGVVGPMPLVVFATGYGGDSMNWSGLTDHWVRAGYVVASPTFPLSCRDAPGGTSGSDLASQPGDVAFVTRQVLDRAAARGSELDGLVDADRVALAGKSFGAITVLEAGYCPAEQVPNIRAVVSMTGWRCCRARSSRASTRHCCSSTVTRTPWFPAVRARTSTSGRAHRSSS